MPLFVYKSSFAAFVLFTVCICWTTANDQKRILIQDNYYEIVSRLDNLTKKMEAMEKNVGQLQQHQVAFVAYLSKSIAGQNHQIVFDDVRLNIGNAYKSNHGNFIAPVNGTYQFTITACSAGGHYVTLELTLNAVVVDKVLAGDTSYDDCNTGVFFHSLSAGDDVYVQHETSGDYLLRRDVDAIPMFTGLLVNAL